MMFKPKKVDFYNCSFYDNAILFKKYDELCHKLCICLQNDKVIKGNINVTY